MKTDGSDQNQKGQQTTAAAKTDNQANTLRRQIEKMMPEFQKALAGKITPERFMRMTVTAIQQAPKLAECSQISFFGALMQACQLQLEPNTPLGQAYLIPRWNSVKKCLECNFQLGYQGVIDLAYRTGLYKRIDARVVYEGDKFKWKYGKDAYLDHEPTRATDKGKPVDVYAEYELTNGGYVFEVWTWEDVMKHAQQFSDSYENGKTAAYKSPWTSSKESQEAMACKTVLVSLLKYAPKSVQVAEAVNTDERTLNYRTIEDGQTSYYSYDIDIPPAAAEVVEGENQEEWQTQGEETKAKTSNGNGAAETGNQNGKAESAPASTPVKQKTNGNAGNTGAGSGNGNSDRTPGRRTSGLFSRNEEEELEEMHRRRQEGVEPPDFN